MTQCPYCKEKIEIDHTDGYGYEEAETYQQECSRCGKSFVYTTEISISHTTFKADCLNGSPHKFKPTSTFPKEYTMMECEICGEKRKPTAKEMEAIF